MTSASNIMWLAIIALLGGALVGLIGMIRNAEQKSADRFRTTYELFFPASMGPEQVLNFIRSLSGLPKPKVLQPTWAVSFERYSSERGERYFVHLPGPVSARLDELMYVHLDVSLEPVKPEDDPIRTTRWEKAIELGMRGINKPLNIHKPEATAASMDAQFKSLAPGEAVVLQHVLFPSHPQAPTEANKAKLVDNTYHVITRVGAVGERPQGMVLDVLSVFRSVEAPGTHFAARLLPDVPGRINRRSGTFGFPIYLNAGELSAVIGWPLTGGGARKAKRLAPTVAHDGPSELNLTFGKSNAPKMRDRLIAMPLYGEQNRSIHIVGESGSGKSVLLENLAVQIIARPDIAFLGMEPAGDLIEHIAKCIPEHRWKDVIYFNPLDTEYPIGINPLKGNDPEQVASHIVAMMKTLYKDTWSASMQRTMTTAVTTAALRDGTLYDAMLLLTSEEFRTSELRKLSRRQYPDLFESWDSIVRRGEIATDSTVNRFHSLMGFRIVRNMLSQREGLDFDKVLREHKVVLMPLPGARMGATNASVIGSLAREMMQSALMRQPPPAASRHKATIMLDEAQNYLSESLSETDAFAEIRKFGGQFIVANQFVSQLGKLQETVGQNVPTKVTFRTSPEEAGKLKGYFGPLKEDDLSSLGKYDIALKANSSGGMAPTVTVHTPPPPQVTGFYQQIIDNTRKLYAKPRAEVEADIAARHAKPEPRQRPKIGDLVE